MNKNIDAVAVLREALNICRHEGNRKVYEAANVGIDELIRLTTDRASTVAKDTAGEPVAWANWKEEGNSYVPFKTREQAEASVKNSYIAATQEGPYKVVPLYAAPISEDSGKGEHDYGGDAYFDVPAAPSASARLEEVFGKSDAFAYANEVVRNQPCNAAPSSIGDALPKTWMRRAAEDCSRLRDGQYMQAEIDDLRDYILADRAARAVPTKISLRLREMAEQGIWEMELSQAANELDRLAARAGKGSVGSIGEDAQILDLMTELKDCAHEDYDDIRAKLFAQIDARSASRNAGVVLPTAGMACSACYGTGYGVDGKPCPIECRPPAATSEPDTSAKSKGNAA